ncbi:unnamed protein product [Pseudo-nitzschia multistriata]|uniref:Uncharacterized protein n=1 Tax=Pseudo-nitzschia multistriata TaxID=183589 RepID=A0A448YY84_9STRA|nr:unnamed protein product [Pseudo-nitzschia multistriata]
MSDVFSPYQIDYSVKNTSKTFGFSKKRITFKFGVANPPAVANGENGANCRGSEHEVIFTWSLNSGKRQILLDGKDVHYSETGQNGWTADQIFQHHFQVRVAGLSGPLRAHLITQPANKDVPHIKPFDLRLNGVSYFAMPKIFELGGPRMIVRPVKGKGKTQGGYSGGQRNEEAYVSPAEREAIAAAKLASMQDLQRSAPAPAPVADLLSFDAAPAQAPVGAYGHQPPQQPQYSNYSLGSSVASQPQQPPPAAYGAQPGGSFSYGQQPPPQQQQAYYGQQQPPPPGQGSFYGQQPPPALAPGGGAPSFDPNQPSTMASPSSQSMASYQSYGSAPSFAQPPSQQRPPPPQQQYPPQGYNYGQQPQRY